MTDYVLGFAFSRDFRYVALVKKDRSPPGAEHMIGKWNGIGGKIEDSDKTPARAMAREFEEEAGVYIGPAEWTLFDFFLDKEDGVWVFFVSTDKIHEIESMESEQIEPVFIGDLRSYPLHTGVEGQIERMHKLMKMS